MDTLLFLLELSGFIFLMGLVILVSGAVMRWLGISDPDNSDD